LLAKLSEPEWTPLEVVGVLYLTLTVQLPLIATVVFAQVLPVTVKKVVLTGSNDSAPIVSGAVPALVTVTTLVTCARGFGIVNVSVRVPDTVVSVPLVAEVKVSVPCAAATPVPLRATGEPVTGTLAVMVNVADAEPAAFGENTTVIVQLPGANVVVQVPPAAPAGRE